MSYISKIEKIQREKNIYLIFLNDGRSIELLDEIVIRFGFKTGEVDINIFNEAVEESNYLLGKNYVLKYLKKKDHSIYEIRKHLENKGLSNEIIERVMFFVNEYKLADDKKYTENYILEAVNKGKGKLKIKYELQYKGIDEDIVEQYLHENISEEKEFDAAFKSAERKIEQYNFYDSSYSKIGRYLSSKGYEEEIINKVINKLYNI